MRSVVLGLVVACSVACFDNSIVGGPTVAGTYTLRTVNGSPLPYVLSESGTSKTELLGRAITLHEARTYAETGHLRTTENGQATTVTTQASGSYALFGNSVSFASNAGAPSTIAIIEGNAMKFVEPGITLIFRK